MSDALMRLAERLQEERTRAREASQRILPLTENVWNELIPLECQTAGFVQELVSIAASRMETAPQESLELAQFAIAVCATLDPQTYPQPIPSQLEASAWRELAMAHRYRSEYAAAERSLAAAESLTAASASLGFDHAVVLYARAVIRADQRRFAEAIEDLAVAREVFEEFADEERVIRCEVLRAMIEQRQGAFDKARSTYERILPNLTQRKDHHTLAAVYNNLGHACVALGDQMAAIAAFERALALCTTLEMPGEIARVRAGIGNVLMARGDYERARATLTSAHGEFVSLGLPEEAGLTALDIAEILIVQGHEEAARQMAERALEEFTRAALPERAMTAIAYLREMLPAVTPRVVRHVRNYIDASRRDPELLFVPLPLP